MVAPAWADAPLQAELSRYVEAKKSQSYLAEERAVQQILKQVFDKTSDWDDASIARYVALCKEIDSTLTPQFPLISAELTETLQEEFERINITDSLGERYHANEAAAYVRRRNLQNAASGVLTVLLPSMWASRISKGAQVAQASASLSQLAWQGLKYLTQRTLTALTIGSGATLAAAPAFAQRLAPPAPAEIMSLGVRRVQDMRWEEGREALDGEFLADLYGAENSMLLHFVLSRIGGGASLPAITAELSGWGVAGTGALVIASGGFTYYFAKQIGFDKWSKNRNLTLQKELLNARERALTPTNSDRERMEATRAYVEAAQHLEAFWLREELVKEGLLRTAQRNSLEDQEALVKMVQEAKNLQAKRFLKRSEDPATLANRTGDLETLVHLENLISWERLRESASIGPELAVSLRSLPEKTKQWILEYRESQDQLNSEVPLFRKAARAQTYDAFIAEKRKDILQSLASPFRDEVVLESLFGTQDVIALVSAVGADLALSTDPWTRRRGESVLLRAQSHRALRELFFNELQSEPLGGL